MKELQIGQMCMYPADIIPYVKHNTRENVKYQREPDGQERGINKKQPDLIDGNIELFAKISAHPERVSFKKCDDPLQHIMPALKSYYPRRNAGTFYYYNNYSLTQAKPAIQTQF